VNAVRAFFLEEGSACLAQLGAALDDGDRSGQYDARRLHSATRRLRGSAQLARYGAVARMAGALEWTLKPVARGEAAWEESLATTVRNALPALKAALDGVASGRMEPDTKGEDRMTQDETGAVEREIGELEYGPREALVRALELRAAVEDAVVNEAPVGPVLDELFDLVRMGLE
jgi:chemotaxis protein histidine kinase CheA